MSNVDFGIRINVDGAQQATQQTAALSRNFSVLETVAQRFGGVIGAVAGTALTRGFVQLADSVTVLRNQLSLATGSVQQAEVAYSSLFQIAQRSRQSFTELGATFASISRATGELGISQGRLLAVTEAIGNAIAISGGSAAGAQAALMQLSQGFASGTLRGEELNSVMEQTPRLARAIADGLGITIGQLRAMGQEGKLTAQAVLGALEAQAQVLSGEVASSVATVAQSSTVARNALTALVGEIDRVTGSSTGMAAAIIKASQSISDIAQALKSVEGSGREVVSIGDGIAVLFETLTVLGANVAYVFTGIRNEIGGLAAQAVALATGQFAEAANIRAEMVAEAEKARKDIDALTQRVLQARGLREIAEQSLQGVDTRAEDARLRRQGVQQQAVAAAVKATAEQLRAAAQEAKKQQSVINDLLGVTDDYVESLRRLLAMRNAGKLSEEQYLAAVLKTIGRQQVGIDATKRQAQELRNLQDAQDALAESEEEFARYEEQKAQARRDAVAQVAQQLQGLQDEAEAARVAALLNVTHAQAIARVTLARMEDQRTRLVNDPAELAALEQKIALQRQLVQATDERAARDTNAKAAQDAAAAWKSTADDIRGALTDAFRRSFESGESFGRAFGQVIEREIKARLASALAGLVTDGILQVVSGAAGQQGAAGGAGGYVQAAQTLSTLYGYGKAAYGYVSGLASTGSTLGASTGAYTSMANGQVLAAYGVEGAGATAGGVTGAAGTSGTAGGVAVSTWVAAIAAGVYKANQDFSEGFRREGAREVGRETGGAAGSFEFAQATILSKLGFSDRLADLLSGATAVAKLIGYSNPTIRNAGIGGSITGGDFTGTATAEAVQKAGVARKLFGGGDKVTQLTSELPEELGRFLDAGAAGILDKAKAYGQALGLPVESLGSIAQQISIKADETGKITEEALVQALSGYGDALVAGFADAVAPLAAYGETTAQTIERVGTAIVGVNEVLDALGATALQASVEGGQAALALQDLFGGIQGLQQTAGQYLQGYYTDAERAALVTKSVGASLAEFGLAVPATREAFRGLVDAQDLTAQSGREAFAALLSVSGAMSDVYTLSEDAADSLAEAALRTAEAAEEAARRAAAAAAELAQSLQDAITGALPKFQTADQRTDTAYSTIAAGLQSAGVLTGVDLPSVLKGATKDDIFEFARSFVELGSNSDEAKLAVVQAADALADLKDAATDLAAQGLREQIDAITQAFGDLSVIDPATLTLSEQFSQNADQIQNLEASLASLLGTVGRSVQEALADMLQSQRSLQTFRGRLADSIFDAQLAGMTSDARVAALRGQEASLFGQLQTASDPAAVAQQLQSVIIARIKEEAGIRQGIADGAIESLREQEKLARAARDAQIDTLRGQISGFERLKQLSVDIAQFTGSLRFSDLSPLDYGAQLSAARGLYTSTLAGARAGDENAMSALIGNSQAYLQEAASFAPVGTLQYAQIFGSVTQALDELGLDGANVDPQIAALNEQLAKLEELNSSQADLKAAVVDTSAEQVEALMALDSALAARENDNQARIDRQIELAGLQIEEIKETNAVLRAQIEQQAAIQRDLREQLDRLLAPSPEQRLAGALPAARAI